MHKNSFTLYHPVGSLRMGVDDKAVLDLQLRVRGVKNLRVCDASIMPQQIACHPTATIIAIAEKTADIIRGKVAVNDDATRHTSIGNGAPVAQSSRL
jgi:choline dehydrogenase